MNVLMQSFVQYICKSARAVAPQFGGGTSLDGFFGFFTIFQKIYLKKVARFIDIFITLFSNRHIVK